MPFFSQVRALGSQVTLIVSIICLSSVAIAETRHAFVVSNESYVPEIGRLAFPHRDGEIMSSALESLGFKVRKLRDGSGADFRQALQQFEQDVRAGGQDPVLFFYFSGHAAEDGERNYLILSDGWPQGIVDRGQAVTRIGVPFSEVTNRLAALGSSARFVVVDSHLDHNEPSLILPGQLLSTQGRPGLDAADSNNFSLALASALVTPGLDADAVFRQVQVKVAEVTNGRQIPYFVNKIKSTYRFERSRTAEPQVAEDILIEEPIWLSVRDSRDITLLSVYLKRFPQGVHAEEARGMIAEIERLNAVSAKAEQRAAPALGRRVALVLGNSAYQQVNYLKNPINDAKAMAKMLKELNFEVIHEHLDLGRVAMLQALKNFGEAAKGADWVMIYYAGHGMEVKGVNYLIPIDAKLADEEDVAEEAVPVDRLFDRLRDAAGVKVIILDACRDNPLATRMFRRGASRSAVTKGLAEIKAASGTLIAYATNPGAAAFDGDDDIHSPYVRALLKHMVEPGRDVRLMFSSVYETVEAATNKRQQPWFASQLPGRDLILKPH